MGENLVWWWENSSKFWVLWVIIVNYESHGNPQIYSQSASSVGSLGTPEVQLVCSRAGLKLGHSYGGMSPTCGVCTNSGWLVPDWIAAHQPGWKQNRDDLTVMSVPTGCLSLPGVGCDSLSQINHNGWTDSRTHDGEMIWEWVHKLGQLLPNQKRFIL